MPWDRKETVERDGKEVPGQHRAHWEEASEELAEVALLSSKPQSLLTEFQAGKRSDQMAIFLKTSCGQWMRTNKAGDARVYAQVQTWRMQGQGLEREQPPEHMRERK